VGICNGEDKESVPVNTNRYIRFSREGDGWMACLINENRCVFVTYVSRYEHVKRILIYHSQGLFD